jgi:hypothetical protein
MTKPDDLKDTKALMGALARMKPKPHDEMKVGKKAKKSAPKKRGAPKKKESKHV